MDYLVHHGIKGQRWGIRRYQNEDGSYTDLGKSRVNKKGHMNPYEQVSNDYRNVSNVASNASNIARSSSGLARKHSDAKKRETASKIDVSNMTNQELQAAINRMNLERSYKSLKAESMSSGKHSVDDILSTAGEVLAIGASAATIAATVYQLKKK